MPSRVYFWNKQTRTECCKYSVPAKRTSEWYFFLKSGKRLKIVEAKRDNNVTE